jgi:hypothetical protein
MKATGSGSRAVWGAILVFGMLLLGISASATAEPTLANANVSSGGVSPSAALPGDWLSRVQQDLAEQEYHLTRQENSCIEGLGSAWQAPNRAHDLRTYFTEDGPRVVRRTESEPTWVWGLELIGITNDECRIANSRTRPVLPDVREVVTNGSRIEFHREGGLVEWYVNDARGLEQGFTIERIPSESPLSQGGKTRWTPLVEGGWGGFLPASSSTLLSAGASFRG